jgi:hypothetical protein
VRALVYALDKGPRAVTMYVELGDGKLIETKEKLLVAAD